MLESVDLTPTLRKGVTPFTDDAASEGFLSAAYNGRVTDRGFVARDWETLLSTATTIASPFPQAFSWESQTKILLLHATKIYQSTGSVETELPVYADTSYISPGVLAPGASALTLTASGNVWQVAFLDQGFVATDGLNLLFYVPSVGLFKHTGTANTVCEHYGRLYLGGFTTDTPIYSAAYKAKVQSFSTGKLISSVPNLESNFILASCVGYDDVLDLLAPWRMTEASYRGQLERNEGLVAALSCGVVYRLLPLEDKLICYGLSGIFSIKHQAEPNLLEVIRVSNKGIKGLTCAGGGLYKHLFIDADGNICFLSRKGIEVAGFRTLGATLSVVNILQDVATDDFIVTNTTACYLFSDNRLSTLQTRVTGSISVAGSKVGYYQAPAAGSYYITIVTGVIRLGTADFKTITGLELDSNSPTSVYGCIYYRLGPADSWAATGWIAFDKTGYLDFPVSCSECMIALRTAYTTSVNTDFNGLRLVLSKGKLGLKELL